MIKQNGGGICWHEVGTGKTMIMCVAAYELKRLGMVQKPLIIGLKANVHEIADTFRKAYPAAKVLYPGKEDFTPANRKEVFSKIKNNNWDCIILTHDQFSKIPQSEETMYDIFSEELADVERSLEVLEQSTMRYRSGRMQKGLETRKQNLKAKLAELQMKIDRRKDDTVDFRLMGIDHIFVDECHCYKNLMFQTRHTRVAGIGNAQGSQRAMNLLFAIRDIQRRTGKDLGATFLSGTVVVNALTELYVMFKYLRPRELKRQQVSCFDAWAAIFTKKTADYELNVTGTIKRKERFRTYIKVPELAMFLREITDYRTADMINLDVPDKNVRFLSSAPTIQQEEMIGRLVAFAHSGQWEDLGLDIPQPDNLDKAKCLSLPTWHARCPSICACWATSSATTGTTRLLSAHGQSTTTTCVRPPTGVHSSSSATFPPTSRTSGTSTATSRTNWWLWGFLPMKSSLSSAPRPNGRERNSLRT